jgi:hypothetical protein
MSERVTIYTDGACAGNPGPGGWGAILLFKGKERELSGGEALTTNNRMELQAAIEGLRGQSGPRRLGSDPALQGQGKGALRRRGAHDQQPHGAAGRD